MKTEWWWLDTGWGCGGVETRGGVIVSGAPIFRRLIGQRLDRMHYAYRRIE